MKMQVELLDYQPNALEILLTTKGTRLAHGEDPATWSEARKAEHLAYMRDTIKSSWEFCDYIFRISGVTRVFTHQLVRTRTGSYAQEAQRAVDVSDHDVICPDTIMNDPTAAMYWDRAVQAARNAYSYAVDHELPPGDARGILPAHVTTSIMAKFNLRTLSNMAEMRLCTRAQGEYQNVFRAMRDEVVRVHPWAADFIKVGCAATGRCIFPNYGPKSCPVYSIANARFRALDREPDLVRQIETMKGCFEDGYRDAPRYEANPVAKDGMAK
jgi:flavin-dependent thymidylate synthase